MDADEIRTLLGEMVFERAQKYRRRILQSSCTTNEDGVRHVSALVQGNGADCFYTQVWLRRTAALSVPPATVPTTRTATAPTASTLARCCWRMRPSTPPPRHRPPRNPSRAWCAAPTG